MAALDGTGGRRRRRRSSAEVEKLAALRRAHAEQLEKLRDQAARVDAALGPFAEALAAIEAAQASVAARKLKLEERLASRLQELDAARVAAEASTAQAREEAEDESAGEVRRWRAVMGDAVRAIRAAGVDANRAAGLLGVSVREVNALMRVTAGDVMDAEPPGKRHAGPNTRRTAARWAA